MHSAHTAILTKYYILKNEVWRLVIPLPIATNHEQNYHGIRELAHSYVLECWGTLVLGMALGSTFYPQSRPRSAKNSRFRLSMPCR